MEKDFKRRQEGGDQLLWLLERSADLDFELENVKIIDWLRWVTAEILLS